MIKNIMPLSKNNKLYRTILGIIFVALGVALIKIYGCVVGEADNIVIRLSSFVFMKLLGLISIGIGSYRIISVIIKK